MIWTGLTFVVLNPRDGGFLHTPGLFAFARGHLIHDAVLLFAG